MSEYDVVLKEAEDEAARGRFKDAYNLLAHAPWSGEPADRECRYRRGLYAYEVAHSRLNDFRDSPTPKLTLIKAGCWLSRSEAYLTSASEDITDAERADIEQRLRRTEEEQRRFRELCREFADDLFVSPDEEHHD